MSKIALILATAFNILSISGMFNPKSIASRKFDRRKQSDTYEHKKISLSVINRVRTLEQLKKNKISRRDKEIITRDQAQRLLQEIYHHDNQESINESLLNS